ncbi:hypothetical protein P7C70_g8469, partial [Phenoliferia sp. Uapishka_3]
MLGHATSSSKRKLRLSILSLTACCLVWARIRVGGLIGIHPFDGLSFLPLSISIPHPGLPILENEAVLAGGDPAAHFRLETSFLRSNYETGDIMLIKIKRLSGGDPLLTSSFRHQITGTAGQHLTALDLRGEGGNWVVPLLFPGNYTLSVRLWHYEVPDALDRPITQHNQVPRPEFSVCYDNEIQFGRYVFSVRTTSGAVENVYHQAQQMLNLIPMEYKTSATQAVGSAYGKTCYGNMHSSHGAFDFGGADSPLNITHFHPMSGCQGPKPLHVGLDPPQPILPHGVQSTSVQWIRLLGDSNTRHLFKNAFIWNRMRIPEGTYPEELKEHGTFPCIWEWNPVTGKDEQFLCLLVYSPIHPPIAITMEWYNLDELDSRSLKAVYCQNLQEVAARAYHNITTLNGPMGYHFHPSYPVHHTVETLLAPWPALLHLEHADHTFISFGSHKTEATIEAWRVEAQELLNMWPRRVKETENGPQPLIHNKREDLTILFTTAANPQLIPKVLLPWLSRPES